MSEQLIRDLEELGRSVPTPEAPGLEAGVLARVAHGSRRPRFARPRARLVAAVVAGLLALLAAPPVRAAVADWFGFGSVVVHRGDGDGGRSSAPMSPPPVGPDLTFAEAAAQVDFVVFELSALGEPQGAEVSGDRRVLSLGWTDGIRLDQSSSLSYTFDKTSDFVDLVTVNGREALWFQYSHDVVLVEEDGTRRQDTERRSGRTLVWTVGDTTLRLEGATLTQERAIEIAESAEPVE